MSNGFRASSVYIVYLWSPKTELASYLSSPVLWWAAVFGLGTIWLICVSESTRVCIYVCCVCDVVGWTVLTSALCLGWQHANVKLQRGEYSGPLAGYQTEPDRYIHKTRFHQRYSELLVPRNTFQVSLAHCCWPKISQTLFKTPPPHHLQSAICYTILYFASKLSTIDIWYFGERMEDTLLCMNWGAL